MTNEEAKEFLVQSVKDDVDIAKVADAIKALEQQPSEDCISRANILDAIETWDKFGINAEQKLIRWQDHYVPYVHLDDVRHAIANMPSVTPKSEYSWKEIKIKFECDDCISRQAVIQKINNKLNPCTDMFKCLELSEIKEDVENLPSVKPTRPKGKWIDDSKEDSYYANCSHCNYQIDTHYERGYLNYCPNCGAKMQEVEE